MSRILNDKMNEDYRFGQTASTLCLSGHLICVSLDEVRTVQTYLPEHIRLTRLEPGCLSFEVTQTDDPMIWRVEERFTDQSAFEAHQVRTKASTWGTGTSSIRREYEIVVEG